MHDVSLNDLKLIQNNIAPVLKFIFVILIAVHADIRAAPFQSTMYSHPFLHEIMSAAVAACSL
jgi:hypothetical protein